MTQRLSDYPGGELGHHVHLRILSRVKHNSLLAISLFQTTEAPLTRQEDRACFPQKMEKWDPFLLYTSRPISLRLGKKKTASLSS